jgi:glycine oxidase
MTGGLVQGEAGRATASRRVVVAGAGLLGRLIAWRLAREGHDVRVVDPAPGPGAPVTGRIDVVGDHAAAFAAAGMLSPWAELDHAPPEVARLGRRSLSRWVEIATALGAEGEPLVRRAGSLLVAHRGDEGAAARALARIRAGAAAAFGLDADRPEGAPSALDPSALRAMEPVLAPGLVGWSLAEEGQVQPREMLALLARRACGVTWHWSACVADVGPGELRLADGRTLRGDLAIDVRGLGAREPLPRDASPTGPFADLRGVRGELLWLHAPGVALSRPVRLLHPRHRVYLAPRPGDLVVVGASEIECEDRSPVSLRSAVELMAAAHSIVPALAEARLVHLESHLRPALPDHRPRVEHGPGLLRINGLFRHGWLVAPALVDDALAACGLARAATREEGVHG